MQFTKSHIIRHLFLIILFIGCAFTFYGQTAYVNGTITDENNKPVDLANVSVIGEKNGTISDNKGKFRLAIPAGKEVMIGITYIGFADKKYPITLKEGEERDIDFQLTPISTDLPGFEVKDEKLRTESMVRLNPKDANVVSSLTGGVTDLIKTLPGVSSSSELS
ncbi:MAG: hypothetical protein C0591_04855 [Marinilabiliales bacterium]|nr:MAG: hypothetical protein C0591_04855 [Marinilabiliales bacterium]